MNTSAAAGELARFEIIDGRIGVITMNRPEARNAMSPELSAAMEAHVKEVESNPDIWVGILASSSDRAFCAGADLAAISEGRGHLIATKDGGFGGFVDARRYKPWIAAVRGFALGGGCELVLACDMVVASQDARFGLPEVKRGLFAGAGGVHRLPRVVPRNVALEMIATGEPIDVARAHHFGWVNRVVANDQVLEGALALARQITANAPISVRQSLRVARVALEAPDTEMRRRAAEAADANRGTEDSREGPRAFLEKRAPNWVGR